MFSLYANARNPQPKGTIDVKELYNVVQSDKVKKGEINYYRKVLDEKGKKDKHVNFTKTSLSAFTACELSYRDLEPDNLIKYNGHIIIDLDDVKAIDIEELRTELDKYPDAICGFVSPSNNGYKVIHQTVYDESVDVSKHHLSAFYHYRKFYEDNFGLEIDEACKDYTRLCFISSDSRCHFQPTPIPKEIEILSEDYFLQQEVSSSSGIKVKIDSPHKEEYTIPASYNFYNKSSAINPDHAESIVSAIFEYLGKVKENIVEDYGNWITVCYALKNILNEDKAKFWFHELSRQDFQDYSSDECDEQYESCKIRKEEGAGMGSLIYLAKSKGFETSDKSVKKYKSDLIEETFLHALIRHNLKIRYNYLNDALEYNIDCKVNLKSKDIAGGNSYWTFLKDVDIDVLRFEVFKGAFDKTTLISKLKYIAPNYNALTAFIQEIQTTELEDEKDYIKELADTVTSVTDNSLKVMLIKKWLVGLIAEILNPSKCQNDNILVFQGAQGIGKSRWSYKLMPDKYDSLLLNKNINPKDKDDRLELTRKVIIFMDEMDTVINSKASVESLKSITSQRKIEDRQAYAHVTDRLPKIDSFIGCINNVEFLRDTTGNRRFFVIETTALDHEHSIDMMKVYAYAYKLYSEGYRHYLNDEERQLVEENNKRFEVQTDEENLIHKWLVPCNTSFMDLTEIKKELNRLHGEAVIKHSNNLGKHLTKNGFSSVRKSIKGKQVRVYFCKTTPTIDEIDIAS